MGAFEKILNIKKQAFNAYFSYFLYFSQVPTNESGFVGLSGVGSDINGLFCNVGNYGYLWSS
jgi:hypothetical protein